MGVPIVRPGRRIGWRLAFLPLVLAMLATACGGDGGGDESASPEKTLVIGAEQEGDCADWMGSCGGTSWFWWSYGVLTMPQAYSVEKAGDGWAARPTSLLTGPATLTTSPRQVVTYTINPLAKWSDGTPITSTDFKFTWEQVANGTDVYDRTGYDKIEGIDDSRPDTAVVTFREPFADWRTTLFAGSYGIYPSHLVKDHAEMADGYTFSGGPWRLDHWTRGTEWVLVPNENYWGEKPKLDKVVFKLITDTSAEFQAFTGGEVLAIYPQPQVDAIDRITAGLPGAKAQYTDQTGNSEALWLNAGKPPFDDVNFRTALAYSIDRDALVNRLFGGIGVTRAVNTLTPPILAPFASADAFAGFTKDLAKVDEAMTRSGWTKGGDGIWEKGGEKAAFEMKTTTGNKRRELTEQILQQELKEAGFTMTINNQASGDLFGDQLPKGDFQAALYANVLTSFYPTNCNLFCSKNVPTAENDFSGQNWTFTNDPALDATYGRVEGELDEEAARVANRQGDIALAASVSVIPLDPLPNILLTSTRIVGTVADNPIHGPFWEMWGWDLTP
jgi:peptide/nickel transport system substrate-binding protein